MQPYRDGQPAIILTAATIELLLRQPEASDLLAMYTLAAFQTTCELDTNRTEISKTLRWPRERLLRTFKSLLRLGLFSIPATRKRGKQYEIDFDVLYCTGADQKPPYISPPKGGVRPPYGGLPPFVSGRARMKNKKRQEQISCTPGRSNTKPFFRTDKPITKEARFDTRIAMDLIRIVEKYRIQKGRTSTPQWAQEVRKLRMIDKLSCELITQVVSWYAEHYTDRFTPRLYHAVDLRNKFTRIVNRMKSQQEEAGDEEQEDLEVTVTQKKVPGKRGVIEREFRYNVDTQDSQG